MSHPKTIVITTGDLGSIGLEVTMKALESFKASRNCYLIFRGAHREKVCWQDLPKNMTLRVRDPNVALEAASRKRPPYRFIEILSDDSPAHWVKWAAEWCLDSKVDGMVTGPVSKKTFLDADLNYIGHTPLLQAVCKSRDVYMGFLGKYFNVILLTGHIPLSLVESNLTRTKLNRAIQTITKWHSQHWGHHLQKPLGLLGLNPHNGEDGLIGNFEKRTLTSILSKYSTVAGPLVPDAAFQKDNWKKYTFFLSLYHDQGLIPFKMIHGHSGGAHVTVGLPIVRTSVDHGTALDLYGKGLASPNSMRDAIRFCETFINRKG